MVRAAVIALLLAATPAIADPPDDIVARPFVTADGGFDIRLVTEIWVRKDFVAHPLSYAPDIYWGATPRLTIGLIHSDASLDRIDAGASFCFLPSDISTCHDLYRGSGADVIYSLLAGQFSLAPRFRAVIRDVDPFKPAVTLGALVRWTTGRYAITSDPYVRLPLYNHDQGNRAALVVPLWLALQPTRGFALALHTGFDGDFAVLADGWHMPLGLVAQFRLGNQIDLGIEGGWGKLLGPQHDAGLGALMVTAGYRTR